MYANVNAPPNVGANVSPMPTYTAPAFDYGCPTYAYPTYCRNDSFILIVVLFILLIIVGAACFAFDKY
jgi:uncharacterized protein (TIGR01732 family)